MLTRETVPGLNFQVRNVRRTDLSRSGLPVLCAIEALITLPLVGSTDTTQTPLPATLDANSTARYTVGTGLFWIVRARCIHRNCFGRRTDHYAFGCGAMALQW